MKVDKIDVMKDNSPALLFQGGSAQCVIFPVVNFLSLLISVKERLKF